VVALAGRRATFTGNHDRAEQLTAFFHAINCYEKSDDERIVALFSC
jgi:calcineurin-like phosphoesterase family protein